MKAFGPEIVCILYSHDCVLYSESEKCLNVNRTITKQTFFNYSVTKKPSYGYSGVMNFTWQFMLLAPCPLLHSVHSHTFLTYPVITADRGKPFPSNNHT
jgi:hypothetical protein